MNVMIMNVEAGQRCGVFVYLPFTPSGVGRTIRVASWTPQYGLKLMSKDLTFFPEKAANFYGAPVPFASNNFPPYWMQYDEEVEGGATVRRYSGRGFMLADACAGKLNYTMTQFPTNDWTEVIVVLKNRSAYFSPATYSVMPHHQDIFSYSISIEPDTMTFAMAVPSLPPRWRSLLYPFTSLVWIFTLLAITFFSPAFLLISYGSVAQSGRGRNNISTQFTVEATATLLGQNLPPRLPTHTSVRVLMGTWLLFGLVITIVYRTNLTAYLTIPKLPPRIETLHQLITSGYRATVANDDGDDLMAYFGKSGAKDSQELSRRMYKVKDTLTGLKRTLHNKEAFVYVRVLMEAYIAEHLTGPDGKAKVYVASENISPGITAWHIIRDAFFQSHLDHCLLSLIEAGLSDRWMKEMLDKVRWESRLKQRQELQAVQEGGQIQDVKEHSGSSQGLQSFTLVHMQGAFYLFFIGVTLSVLSFALESLVSQVSKSA
uniref:Variant Ionotropic Glutamate Receptor n=1 Tax=Coenobita clypeatus TaxID=474045 RepID=A0A0A8P118_9EUCA|nr:Variant Ionotropic Glutamate Receptor [Coenobita clypeatus]